MVTAGSWKYPGNVLYMWSIFLMFYRVAVLLNVTYAFLLHPNRCLVTIELQTATFLKRPPTEQWIEESQSFWHVSISQLKHFNDKRLILDSCRTFAVLNALIFQGALCLLVLRPTLQRLQAQPGPLFTAQSLSLTGCGQSDQGTARDGTCQLSSNIHTSFSFSRNILPRATRGN